MAPGRPRTFHDPADGDVDFFATPSVAAAPPAPKSYSALMIAKDLIPEVGTKYFAIMKCSALRPQGEYHVSL